MILVTSAGILAESFPNQSREAVAGWTRRLAAMDWRAKSKYGMMIYGKLRGS
jgi:hypothetical protein